MAQAQNFFPEDTTLSQIPGDLRPLIKFYWLPHKRIQDRPTLRPSYHFKGQYGESNSTPELKEVFSVEVNGAALDASANMWISCGLSPRIRAFQHGTHQHIVSLGPSLDRSCTPEASPLFLTFDQQQNLIAVDVETHQVYVYTPQGDLRYTLGNQKWPYEGEEDGHFKQPQGAVVDDDGNLLIADAGNHRIQVFNSDGVFQRKFGTKGRAPHEFSSPSALVVDNSGNYIICDSENHRIKTVNPHGSLLRLFGEEGSGDSQFYFPMALGLDKEGAIIVADFGNHRIKIFSPDGLLLMKFGAYGGLHGQLYNPMIVLLDKEANILVLDANERLQCFG